MLDSRANLTTPAICHQAGKGCDEVGPKALGIQNLQTWNWQFAILSMHMDFLFWLISFVERVMSFITNIASITTPRQIINSQLYHVTIFPVLELLLPKKLTRDRYAGTYISILHMCVCVCVFKLNTHPHQNQYQHFIEHLSWSLHSRSLQFNYGRRRDQKWIQNIHKTR